MKIKWTNVLFAFGATAFTRAIVACGSSSSASSSASSDASAGANGDDQGGDGGSGAGVANGGVSGDVDPDGSIYLGSGGPLAQDPAKAFKVGVVQLDGRGSNVEVGVYFFTVEYYGRSEESSCTHRRVGSCDLQTCSNVAYDDPDDHLSDTDAGVAVEDMAVGAGTIGIAADGKQTGFVSPLGGDNEYQVASAIGDAGAVLSVSATGGQFPAFDTSITLPGIAAASVSPNNPTTDESATFSWTGGDSDAVVWLQLRGPALADGSPSTNWAICSAPASSHSLVVSQDILTFLGTGSVTVSGFTQVRKNVAVTNGEVYLEASEQLGGEQLGLEVQ